MHTGRMVIKGGTVVAATGAPPIRDGAVVIEDGRIAAIGPAGQFGTLEGEVVDAGGGTILPGLIDSHMHIFHEAQLRRLPEGTAALWGVRYAQVALRGGVTTVRDLGAQMDAVFGVKRAVASGWAVGPRVLACGRAICMTGGHGWANLSVEADGPDGVRRAARQQIRMGADVIKVMASGGAGTPGELATQPQLTVAELRAAVEEAHARDKPCAAHALAAQGVRNALEAGVDTIEHGVYLEDDCIETMVRRGVPLCPTISVYPRVLERGAAGGEAPFMIGKSQGLVDVHFASLQRAVAAGVRIVFGTDSATLYNPLGDIDTEMELMVRAGMTPLDAIVAATRTAAEVCGIADEVGTLRPGLRADVLVVDGDATADIAALQRVRLVLRDGVEVYAPGGRWPSRADLIEELR